MLRSGFTTRRTEAVQGLRFRNLMMFPLAGPQMELVFRLRLIAPDCTSSICEMPVASEMMSSYMNRRIHDSGGLVARYQYMIFSEIDAKTKWDLWVLRLGEQRKVFPFLVTRPVSRVPGSLLTENGSHTLRMNQAGRRSMFSLFLQKKVGNGTFRPMVGSHRDGARTVKSYFISPRIIRSCVLQSNLVPYLNLQCRSRFLRFVLIMCAVSRAQ